MSRRPRPRRAGNTLAPALGRRSRHHAASSPFASPTSGTARGAPLLLVGRSMTARSPSICAQMSPSSSPFRSPIARASTTIRCSSAIGLARAGREQPGQLARTQPPVRHALVAREPANPPPWLGATVHGGQWRALQPAPLLNGEGEHVRKRGEVAVNCGRGAPAPIRAGLGAQAVPGGSELRRGELRGRMLPQRLHPPSELPGLGGALACLLRQHVTPVTGGGIGQGGRGSRPGALAGKHHLSLHCPAPGL